MQLAWITDPHLDFLPPVGSTVFGQWAQKVSKADAVVITGDIGEYPALSNVLTLFVKGFGKPTYFVLGNHDFYRGSIAKGEQAAAILHESVPLLTWLDIADPVELTHEVGLVGSGGWYDARSGDPEGSNVVMNDFNIIEDFRGKFPDDVRIRCRQIAVMMAERARAPLTAAAEKYKHVFFATHVPPFREACWHQGKISDSDWLPWFTNLTCGALLADVASAYPETKFTVLCGHTHSPGTYQHLDNLTVLTGRSQYSNPMISKVFTLQQGEEPQAEDPAQV